MERRHFIIGAVAGGVGLFEYAIFNGWMRRLRQGGPHLRVSDYLARGEAAALAAITPVEDFYKVQIDKPAVVKASEWRLKIAGLVERPLTLTLDEIRGLPAVERTLTLECIDNRVGGNFIGNARWRGVALAPLLAEAGVNPQARYAACYGADAHSTGHTLERLSSPDVFLAYEMNGEPLTVGHGFPLRILIPGKFGMKQPKWLTRIEILDEAYLGYWERKGWSDLCERAIHARFDSPERMKRLQGASFVLTGYALGNRSGVRGVEISTDGGTTWAKVDVFSNPSMTEGSLGTWAFWKFLWKPAPGSYELRLRGTGGDGRVQQEGPQEAFPEGATGQQVVRVDVEG